MTTYRLAADEQKEWDELMTSCGLRRTRREGRRLTGLLRAALRRLTGGRHG